MQHRSDVEAADALNQSYQQLRTEIAKVIVGQRDMVDLPAPPQPIIIIRFIFNL